MAITVTATPGGASFSRGVDLEVRVYTAATESGGASNGGRNTAAGAAQGTLTPNFSSSAVVWSITSDTSSTWPAAAASNAYDSGAAHNHTDGWESNAGHYTGTVTSGTPLTYGAGSTATSADHENWCAYEIPAQGGTITLDGSSPASVTSDTGTSAVTASFTPPAGAVLVALVAAGGSGTGAGVTCSISDSSNLQWTQRVTSSSVDNFQPTFIFTATVGLPPAPVSVGRSRPGRTWARRFRNQQPPWIAPPAPPPPGPTGNQPGGPVVYRRPARTIWGGIAAQPGQPLVNGAVPPHLVIGRRAAARVTWRGFVSSTTNAAAAGPNGTAPPHLVIARRTAARGLWRGFVSSTTNRVNGTTPPHLVISRRATARAVIHGNTGIAFPNGTVPPSHLVVSRRAPARAVWRGTVSRTTNQAPGAALVPPHLVIGRRAAARVTWRGFVSSTTNAAPPALVNGAVPPHLVIGRRASTRVVWRGYTSRTTNLAAGSQPGGLVRRRAPARGQWRGFVSTTANQAPGAGRPPKHLVVRRRKSARGYARWTAISTTNAPPPSFLVARSHATVTDPRDGTATVTAIAASRPTVIDPRDGTPGVT